MYCLLLPTIYVLITYYLLDYLLLWNIYYTLRKQHYYCCYYYYYSYYYSCCCYYYYYHHYEQPQTKHGDNSCLASPMNSPNWLGSTCEQGGHSRVAASFKAPLDSWHLVIFLVNWSPFLVVCLQRVSRKGLDSRLIN